MTRISTIPLTRASDFAVNWLKQHLMPQPESVGDSLTWFVGLGTLYADYTTAAFRTPHGALPYETFMQTLRFTLPVAREGKVGRKLVAFRIRYYVDVLGGMQRYGI